MPRRRSDVTENDYAIAEQNGISRRTVRRRLDNGWLLEEAITLSYGSYSTVETKEKRKVQAQNNKDFNYPDWVYEPLTDGELNEVIRYRTKKKVWVY